MLFLIQTQLRRSILCLGFLADKSTLVFFLSKIILETIDYYQYKKLSTGEKDKIKMTIAQYLYEESNKYQSSFHEESEDGWKVYEKNGISFSTRIKEYPYDEAYQVNFPTELFSNQPGIKSCICNAFKSYPNILRKEENTSLEVPFAL